MLTGNVWARVGFHVAFMAASQSLRNQVLFVVDGLDTIAVTVFLAPFVLGVCTTMLLMRDTGTWSGKVPDPVRS